MRDPAATRRMVTWLLAPVLALALVLLTAGPSVAAGRTHEAPRSSGQRIIAVAKRYVGHARYRSGGNSPKHGFDCSGYTQFAYKTAHVAHLPHSAQGQRHAGRMHRISARRARPGDLIFYLDGRTAFHVAIYAGHHMQYAAATPRDGIRYQRIWSSDVQYGTDWH